MTRAVVGVQPFGGRQVLLRYAVERALSISTTTRGGDPALLNP